MSAFVCPRCHKTSYNPNDLTYGYCDNCKSYTGAPHPHSRSQPSLYCPKCETAGHTVADQHCSVCSVYPALHKIGEEGFGFLNFHNLTNYLCCAHFKSVVGDCDKWPTYGHGHSTSGPKIGGYDDPLTAPKLHGWIGDREEDE